VAPGRMVPGTLLHDSARDSVVLVVPMREFLSVAVIERRGCGRCVDVLSADHDFNAQCDALVTCVMVVWAVTIFVGMGCLAALI
jgi:hypothetical protein